MSKYNARKTVVDNIRFDSLMEAQYYQQLKMLKKAKKIADFSLQPRFTLIKPFTDNTGKRQRAMTYTADFKVHHFDGTIEVIEVKGMLTTDYKLRRKLFLRFCPEYKFTEVKA